MRTSFFLTLIAATALLFTGCATKAGGDGYGQDGAAFAGGDASIDPNGAGFDPNDPNALLFLAPANLIKQFFISKTLLQFE